MELLNTRIDKYLRDVGGPSPSPLDRMEAYAREHRFPIIGPLVGRLLQQLVLLTGARSVFELGSGFGYSALWMAMVLPDDGKIICTDFKQANANLARDFFSAAGLETKLDFRVGNALDLFAAEPGPFDLVLNDIDKEAYPETIELVEKRLRSGGVFLTDNILWSGRVLDHTPDPETSAIVAFTRSMHDSPEFLTTVVPLRDGVSLSIRR